MTFTEKTYSTTFYAQMYDPSQPERGFGAFVNRVTIKEFDDGTRVVGPEVQKDMVAAMKEGITLPAVLSEFNIAAAARAMELEATFAKHEREKQALQSQVQKLTGQVVQLREVLNETNTALRDAMNGGTVDASLMPDEAPKGKSFWNPMSWFR
jgi:hypothetical protein